MWQLITISVIVLAIFYCLLILIYFNHFIRLKVFTNYSLLQPKNRFSIVIPARNEELNIKNCVSSILQNNYPNNLFEIIIIDDFSTDKTSSIVKELQQQCSNIRLIQLEKITTGIINSYKKKAIETAIDQSSFEWIVTTDADCTVPNQWLRLFDAYIQSTNAFFIAAPVKFVNNKSILSIFQSLDFISLQGITAASVSAGMHSMCNGANLAYSKKVFHAVNAFKDIDTIASGDDMLLMHKIKQQYPSQIGYLFHPEAVVETLPMPGWKSFINQRIRWASKARSYRDKRIFIVLLVVYLFNLGLVALPFLSIFRPALLLPWLYLLLAKTVCEMIFMYSVSKFFGELKLLKWFPFMQPLHIIYTVISGFLGSFGTYQWKGRTVK